MKWNGVVRNEMEWSGSKKMEWTRQKLNEVESRKGNGQEGNDAEWSGVER